LIDGFVDADDKVIVAGCFGGAADDWVVLIFAVTGRNKESNTIERPKCMLSMDLTVEYDALRSSREHVVKRGLSETDVGFHSFVVRPCNECESNGRYSIQDECIKRANSRSSVLAFPSALNDSRRGSRSNSIKEDINLSIHCSRICTTSIQA
jgi:hypothetical protein